MCCAACWITNLTCNWQTFRATVHCYSTFHSILFAVVRRFTLKRVHATTFHFIQRRDTPKHNFPNTFQRPVNLAPPLNGDMLFAGSPMTNVNLTQSRWIVFFWFKYFAVTTAPTTMMMLSMAWEKGDFDDFLKFSLCVWSVVFGLCLTFDRYFD